MRHLAPGGDAFPEEKEAEELAARLRELGARLRERPAASGEVADCCWRRSSGAVR